MSLKQTLRVTIGLWLTSSYLVTIFLLGEKIFGVDVRLRYWGLLVLLAFVVISFLARLACRLHVLKVRQLQTAALVSVTALVSIAAVDVVYAIYESKDDPLSAESAELAFPCVLDGLLAPKAYRPTEKNFHLYEPHWEARGRACGSWAFRGVDQALMETVVEIRDQWYSTDAHGFRETTPMEDARVFALGDSFTLGMSTHQDKVWTEVLEREIQAPVYNLGGAGSSLKQQRLLLEHLLQTKGDLMDIDRLLWMSWEGNDLEDSYSTFTPSAPSALPRGKFRWLHRFAFWVKHKSVIQQLKSGRLKFRTSLTKAPDALDGLPIYRSDKFGNRVFWGPALERATLPETYVANHPNRPALDQTFRDMLSLSKNYGFDVTVIAAPSAARLYAPYFNSFPRVSGEPHFINYVIDLALEQGFDVINLTDLLQPFGKEELLYWRDDPHWNERGNQVVAEIIAAQGF